MFKNTNLFNPPINSLSWSQNGSKFRVSTSLYFHLICLIRISCYTHTHTHFFKSVFFLFFFFTFVTVVDLAVSSPLIAGIFILLTFLLLFFDPRISTFPLFFIRLPTDTSILTLFWLGFHFISSYFANLLVP
jgi:hypothetical protein